MTENNDPRHYARWYALQKLFNLSFLNTDDESQFPYDQEALKEINESEEADNIDKELADQIVEGVLSNKEKLDETITLLAPERPINQISQIDLQILYMAIYEGFIGKLTPPKVVVNEAIELTKEFASDTDRKFISGVLGNLFENQEKYNELLEK